MPVSTPRGVSMGWWYGFGVIVCTIGGMVGKPVAAETFTPCPSAAVVVPVLVMNEETGKALLYNAGAGRLSASLVKASAVDADGACDTTPWC